MYKKVKNTIEKYDMVKRGDRVLVCVSGGPDSVYLLKSLDQLKHELGVKLVVCNLDHAVRPVASKKDSDFVKKLTKSYGLKLIHKKLNPAWCCNKKLSKEENLRNARYNFFKSAAENARAKSIATGHTLDDNAETVLMRVIKGASLKGLAGIPPVRKLGKYKIIRPLIEIERCEIRESLKKEKTAYRFDKTNLDEAFLRNRVRRKLLPHLEKYNPRVKFALVNMAESLREDLEFIESEKELKHILARGSASGLFINLKDLVVQPKALQREIIKDALSKSGANIKKLKFDHWRELRHFLKFKRNGQSIDLPGPIRITRTDQKLLFKPGNPN